MRVRKRNGNIVDFERGFISRAVTLAAAAAGEQDEAAVQKVTDFVEDKLVRREEEIIDIETIQDTVEEALFEQGRFQTVRAYILYRMDKEKHRNRTSWKEGLLSRDFLSAYKHATSPMGELGSFVYSRTYSRFLPEMNRREFWWETVRRLHPATRWSGPAR